MQNPPTLSSVEENHLDKIRGPTDHGIGTLTDTRIDEDDYLVCKLCNYKTSDSRQMDNHMKNHVTRKVKSVAKSKQQIGIPAVAVASNSSLETAESISETVPDSTKDATLKMLLRTVVATDEKQTDTKRESNGMKRSAGGKGNKLLELVKKLRTSCYENERDDPGRIRFDFEEPTLATNQTSEDKTDKIPGNESVGKSEIKQKQSKQVNSENSTPQNQINHQRQPSTKPKAFECDVCGYKAKWLSELQKHKLVHTNEKPFPCPHCNHRSRWKGDLTRHIQKIHKIFMQPQRTRKGRKSKGKDKIEPGAPILAMPALTTPVSVQTPMFTNNIIAFPGMLPVSETVNPGEETNVSDASKESFPSPSKDEIGEVTNESNDTPKTGDVDERKIEKGEEPESGAGMQLHALLSQSNDSEDVVKKLVYKCKECDFYTKTASRFHVHIVQHLNKKPYMCSDCGYRSNWQWDVTKHIRVKVSKQNTHGNSEVLLIDEAGEKNYEKYKPYMELIEETKVTRKDHQFKSGIEAPSPSTNTQIQDEEQTDKTSSRYLCKVCRFSSCSKDFVIAHVICHIDKYVIPGNIPQPSDEISADLPQFSIITDMNGELFCCTVCPYRSRRNDYIKYHWKQHKRYSNDCKRCPFCPYWVTVEKNLLKHLRLHVTAPSSFLKEVEFLIVYKDGNDSDERKRIDAPTDATRNKGNVLSKNVNKRQSKRHFGSVDVQKCPLCPYSTDQLNLLRDHLQVHEICDVIRPRDVAEAAAATELSTPIVVDTNQVERRPNESELNRRETKDKSPTKMYRCRFCPLVNKRRANIRTHELMHTKEKESLFSCNLCSYSCESQGALTSHLKIHDYNDITYFINSRMKQASAVVEGATTSCGRNASFECRHCPSVFKTNTDLRNHDRFHGSGYQFACPFCNYATNVRPNLHIHIKCHRKSSTTTKDADKNVDDVAMNSLRCKKCPTSFKNIGRLRTHENLHGAKGKFSCSYCDYSVSNIPSFENHVRVHAIADGTPDIAATSNPNLLNGVISNSSDEPENEEFSSEEFSCASCPYRNVRRSAVQNHQKQHVQTENAYPCPFCDFNSACNRILKDHIKVHLSRHVTPEFKTSMDIVEIWAVDVHSNEKNLIFKHKRYDDDDDDEMYYPDVLSDDEDSSDVILQRQNQTTGNFPDHHHLLNAVKEENFVDADAQEKYMEAMRAVSDLDDVFSVINEYLHSGATISFSQENN
ncbi:Uncharacterised protein g5335 [Pycnogonum litorale]